MKRVFIMAAFSCVLAQPALSCSVAGDYRVPTNIELIEEADLVVLARVESGDAPSKHPKPGEIFEPEVTLRPLKFLKGTATSNLKVYGSLKDWRSNKPFPSIPTALDSPNPSALWGACIRQAYAKGGLVVAMFQRTPKGYVQIGHPFARSVEDVASPTALWVRAAEKYVGLLAGKRGSERRKVFEVESARLKTLVSDPDAKPIAADIDRYLDETEAKRQVTSSIQAK